MKGNIHKKITFEDSTEKKYIKSYYKGWRGAEIINRRLHRRRLKAGLKKRILRILSRF